MEVRIIKASDVGRCPKTSLLPGHYRDDGTCRCNERAAAQADEARLRDLLAAARARTRRT